jgi:hypothetical protein
MTGFEGVPHVQSEKVPPVTQLPSDVSKFSLYGKLLIGVVHCEKEKKDEKKRAIEKIVFTSGKRRLCFVFSFIIIKENPNGFIKLTIKSDS